jgi:hypothetical protein
VAMFDRPARQAAAVMRLLTTVPRGMGRCIHHRRFSHSSSVAR